MPLLHINLPSFSGHRYPTYALAVKIQFQLQRRLLDHKASLANSRPPPLPTLLTFTPAPIYTFGRRQTSPLTPPELDRLSAPLHVGNVRKTYKFKPEVVHAPRGGLATYHGPGQVVFWPILDLHSPLHKKFTVRDYACLLEKTTIATLARATANGRGHVDSFTTENPGVWVRDQAGEQRKIAALGVHLRRHVTGLGVAVNVGMPVTGPEEVNPWARIVACGLEDKAVTSLNAEYNARGWAEKASQESVMELWVEEFARRIGVGGGVVDYWLALRGQDQHWVEELNDSLGLATSMREDENSAEGEEVASSAAD